MSTAARCAVVLPLAALLSACAAAAAPAKDGGGDFSVVVGVPPEWVPRIDDPRYLQPAECAELCPAAFAPS